MTLLSKTKNIGKTSREIQKEQHDAIQSRIMLYREKPDIFVEECLEIPLNLYQKVFLRGVFESKQTVGVWSRGLGKSWTSGVAAVALAMLFPNINIGIIAPSFRQSKMLFKEKIEDDLMNRSPLLKSEVKSIIHGTDEFLMTFYNNSTIRAIPLGNDGSKIRGYRFNVVIIDEYAQVNPVVIDRVVIPMLAVKANYSVNKTDYSGDMRNKVISVSSAYFRFNHFYKLFKDTTDQMLAGNKDYFSYSLDYRVGLDVGLFDENDIKAAHRKFSPLDFAMEYGAIFVKLSDNAWISPIDLEECSSLMKIETSANEGYEYIMGLDVARVAGNDNTSIKVIKLVPNKAGKYFEKHEVFARTLNGLTFNEQAYEVRKTLNRFPCVELHMDTTGLGLGLADELAKPFMNPDTGQIDPPICDVNNPQHVEEIPDGNFLIHGHKFNVEFNYQLGVAMKKNTQHKRLRFYANEAVDTYGDKITAEQIEQVEEAKATKREIVCIEATPRGNFLAFDVPRSGYSEGRKDRWTATSLAVLGAEQLEQEYFKEEDDGLMLGTIERRELYE